MGSCVSVHHTTDSQDSCASKDSNCAISEAFADFVELNCVLGADKSVHIQKLECAFALFLKDNNVNVSKMTIMVAHEYVKDLIKTYGWELTPGYADVYTQDNYERI